MPKSQITCSLVFLCLCLFTAKAHATDLFVEKKALYDVSISDSDLCFVAPGSLFTYKFTVTNNSNVEAINVVLTDPLANYISISGDITVSQGSCTQMGGLTCNLGNIPSFGSATVQVTAQLSADAVKNTDIGNTATVTADNEIDPSDNSASFTFTVADVTDTCLAVQSDPSGTSCTLMPSRTQTSRRATQRNGKDGHDE